MFVFVFRDFVSSKIHLGLAVKKIIVVGKLDKFQILAVVLVTFRCAQQNLAMQFSEIFLTRFRHVM